MSVFTVALLQPDAGATPPLVCRRWTQVTLVNTPVPVVDVARSSSQGMAPVAPFDCWTFEPLTTLPSVDVHSGPAPWVPTCVPPMSYSLASGALSTQL